MGSFALTLARGQVQAHVGKLRHVQNFSCVGSLVFWEGVHENRMLSKLTWLGLGGDLAARSLRVEQFTVLLGR